MRLPAFGVWDYRQVLRDLAGAGFSFRTVTALAEEGPPRVVYLRHDVDFDPRSALPIAEAEMELERRATYFVLLTQHYNPRQIDNRRAIRHLAELGHEIGLHYDMETYPSDPVLARTHLEREVAILADVAEAPVRTISMHQPSMGEPDPFLALADLVHPHDPRFQRGLTYVSDSCRAWRDTTLLASLETPGPRRLLLNTHPELWLDGSIRDRMAYLDLLRDRVSGHYRTYFDSVVRHSWRSHAGGRQHDERESSELCVSGRDGNDAGAPGEARSC